MNFNESTFGEMVSPKETFDSYDFESNPLLNPNDLPVKKPTASQFKKQLKKIDNDIEISSVDDDCMQNPFEGLYDRDESDRARKRYEENLSIGTAFSMFKESISLKSNSDEDLEFNKRKADKINLVESMYPDVIKRKGYILEPMMKASDDIGLDMAFAKCQEEISDIINIDNRMKSFREDFERRISSGERTDIEQQASAIFSNNKNLIAPKQIKTGFFTRLKLFFKASKSIFTNNIESLEQVFYEMKRNRDNDLVARDMNNVISLLGIKIQEVQV